MGKNKSSFEITGIHNHMTFSNDSVWVWVKVEPFGFEYTPDEERLSYVHKFDNVLTSLVPSEEKSVDCHLISSTTSFDAAQWIKKLNERHQRNGAGEAHEEYLVDMYQHVAYQDFRESLVLLGVKIGHRDEFLSVRNATTLGSLDKLINTFANVSISDYMDEREQKFWENKSQNVMGSLTRGGIGARPATPAELAYSIRKNMFPAMPDPEMADLSLGDSVTQWGRGEIASLVDASVTNHPKYLKITQEVSDGPGQAPRTMEGYRATLCVTKFPDVLHFPDMPWIHMAGYLHFPVDFSLRFTLEPSRRVRKEVDRRLKEAKDQAVNMTSAGGNMNQEIMEQISRGEELEYSLKQDRTPWVFGRYRLTVEADSEQELRSRVQDTIDFYRQADIIVTWSSGDQLNLLKESFPNDKVRVSAYYQRQELSIISGGIPAGTGSAGDDIRVLPNGAVRGWIGPYIGYTLGATRQPCFFSPHSVINRDNPGVTSITGSPGSGKTFLGLTLTHQLALGGAWTVVIDPKGDALELNQLPGLEAARIIDLRKGVEGLLDPFSIGDSISTQKELAIETLELLLGGSNNISQDQSIELSRAIDNVGSNHIPYLSDVVEHLTSSTSPAAVAIGSKLRLIRDLPFAKLCFSRDRDKEHNRKALTALRPEDGLTIISVLGLDLPPADLSKDAYSNQNKLAVAIMFLLTSFTRQLMLSADKKQTKAIVVDEAWAITSTQQGGKLVKEAARLGRAHNLALILLSQNVGDLMGSDVTNSVSTRFAFKAKEVEEAQKVARYLGLEPTPENVDSIRNLNTGECLLRDTTDRIARLRVDGWNDENARAFETNPEARGK